MKWLYSMICLFIFLSGVEISTAAECPGLSLNISISERIKEEIKALIQMDSTFKGIYYMKVGFSCFEEGSGYYERLNFFMDSLASDSIPVCYRIMVNQWEYNNWPSDPDERRESKWIDAVLEGFTLRFYDINWNWRILHYSVLDGGVFVDTLEDKTCIKYAFISFYPSLDVQSYVQDR